MRHTKASRIEIRANEEAKNLIEKAASITGKTISAYMLNKALASAKKDIEQMESITLGNKDSCQLNLWLDRKIFCLLRA